MSERVFPLQLEEEYNGIPKNRVFEIGTKLYKILGFKTETKPVKVYAVRLLRKTFKPSRKQPIFEIFNFEDTLKQNIKL